MNNNYFIYHLHSDYSSCTTNIDSVTKIDMYIERAKELGMTALAFSEHGNTFNWYEKKTKIEKAGMKYVHAVEAYLTYSLDVKVRDNYHCVLIARNHEGFKELNRLITASNNRKDGHFYYTPRVTFDELFATSDNIIVTSACFTKDMRVLTKEGYKSISEITRNDYILNMFGEYERVNYPTHRMYNGDGVEIKFVGNPEVVRCTNTHKFLTITESRKRAEWVEAKDFNVVNSSSRKTICLMPLTEKYCISDIIKREEWENSFTTPKKPLKVKMPDFIRITPELMRFIGVFIADGHISLHKNVRVGICFNISEFDFCYNSFIKEVEKQLNIKFSVVRRNKYNRVDITSGSLDFVNFIYYLFGNAKADTKFIPKRLLKIKKELSEELLFGYMISDGHFQKTKAGKYDTGRMVCATISLNLIRDLKEAFENIKITLNVRCVKEKIDKNGVHHCKSWYGVVRGLIFSKIKKQSIFSHSDVVEIFENIRSSCNNDFINVDGIDYKKVRIKSVKHIKLNETVYCLNNNTHSFVCEGVVVHNCLASVLNRAPDDVKEKYIEFLCKNKHRCFLEIQHHSVEQQIDYNRRLYKLSQETGVRLITGTDTHSLNEELARARVIEQRAHKTFFSDEEGWDLTFKTYDELVESYKKQSSLPLDIVLNAINNTCVLEEMVEPFEIDTSFKYPVLYEDSENVFRKMVYEAMENHPYALKNHSKETLIQRIEDEIDTYVKTGTVDFMLFKKMEVEWMHQNGIYTGPGRGSCFVGDTIIACKGKDMPLKDVKVGDFVLSSDAQYHEVTSKFQYEVDEEFVEFAYTIVSVQKALWLENTYTSQCTADHRILVNRNDVVDWVEAKNLVEGDLVCVPIMRAEIIELPPFYYVKVSSVKKFRKADIVYDITVDITNDFVANHIVVHNCSGSMICYLLGITDMDSLRFGLEMFRFLNKERVSQADIDTDLYSDDRDVVRNFLLTYDKIYSAEIATFNTIAVKGAIRDVGRALDMPLDEVSSICNKLLLDERKEFYAPDDLKVKYPELFKWVDLLHGVIVSMGTHPAAVLCATQDIREEIGLCSLSTTEHPVTCLDKYGAEACGWTKEDMLG